MSRISLVTITLLVLAGCTTAPPDSDATVATASAAGQESGERTTTNRRRDTDDPDLICRSERVVGSRLPRRICATQREWDAMREGSQETTREIQQLPTGGVEEAR